MYNEDKKVNVKLYQVRRSRCERSIQLVPSYLSWNCYVTCIFHDS